MTIFNIEHSLPSDQSDSKLLQLGQNINLWWAEIQNRRKLRSSLTKLSEKDLRDICVTRNDVQASCNSSLSCDAAQELSKTAKARAGNW